MENTKNIKSFVILINTNYPLTASYCIYYKKIYFYFIKELNQDKIKALYYLYDYVYAVMVFYELDENHQEEDIDYIWNISTNFLRAWTFSNEYTLNIMLSFEYRLYPQKGVTPLLIDVINGLSSKNKSRENTEFKQILDTKDRIKNCPKSFKNHTKAELVSLYSISISDPNVLFKIIFFVNTISYPYENDRKHFIEYVNGFFENHRNDNQDIYFLYKQSDLENDKIFGPMDKDPISGMHKFGEYLYDRIRSSVVHIIRKRNRIITRKDKKHKDGKKARPLTNIEIDNYKHIKILTSAAEVLRYIAKAKLTDEGIYEKYLSNEECYLINSPSLVEIKDCVNKIVGDHIQRTEKRLRFYKNVINQKKI